MTDSEQLPVNIRRALDTSRRVCLAGKSEMRAVINYGYQYADVVGGRVFVFINSSTDSSDIFGVESEAHTKAILKKVKEREINVKSLTHFNFNRFTIQWNATRCADAAHVDMTNRVCCVLMEIFLLLSLCR